MELDASFETIAGGNLSNMAVFDESRNQRVGDPLCNASRDAMAPVQIQDITAALVESGYTSLDQQAKALGLRRSTTWTIIRTKHKLGRLSAKTINLSTKRTGLANRTRPSRIRVEPSPLSRPLNQNT